MAMMPVADGRHHNRRTSGAHGRPTTPKMTPADKLWMTAIIMLPFLLYVLWITMPRPSLWIGVTLAGFMGGGLFRMLHHPGDRHRPVVSRSDTALVPEPAMTGVVLPPDGPAPVGPWLATIKPWLLARMPDKKSTYFFAIAVVFTIVAQYSENRRQAAETMQDDLDRLLKIPGRWNGYQSTERPE